MPKQIKSSVKDAIISDLKKGCFTRKQIGEMNSVGYQTVLRISKNSFLLKEEIPVVLFKMERTDTYQTEEDLLYPRSKFYNATNKDLITPIQKGWELYNLY